jgi:hypothetical protein
MWSKGADVRDVRHYVLTVGRDEDRAPVRELRPLTGGVSAIVALGWYEQLNPTQLNEIINDLLAEQDTRRNGWRSTTDLTAGVTLT